MSLGQSGGLGSGYSSGLGSGAMYRPAASSAPAFQSQAAIATSTPWWKDPAIQNAGALPTPQTDAFNNYVNYQTALNAPTLQGYDLQNAQQSARLGAIQAATGAGNGAAQAQADIAGQKIDNNIASNAIDQAAIPSQIAYNNAMYGVNGQQYQSVQNMVNQLIGNQGNIFLNSKAQADLQERMQRRDWGNTIAAQGSSSAPESGQKMADFHTQDILATDAARNAQTEQVARLTNHGNQALYDYTLQGLSTAQQNARLDDRGKQLDLLAKNYGLDKQALLASLNASLANSNLNGILTAGQVLDGITSNDTQKAQLMNDIVYGAVGYASGQGNGSGASSVYDNPSYSGLPTVGSGSTSSGGVGGGGGNWGG